MGRELTPSRSDVGMLVILALGKLALHLVLSGRYGYWIDELSSPAATISRGATSTCRR